jgi:hypothetical protein
MALTRSRIIEGLAQTGPPKILYHGTSMSRVPSILQQGLLPTNAERAVNDPERWGSAGAISFSDKKDGVLLFASMAAMHRHVPGTPTPDQAIILVDTKKARVHHIVFVPTTGIAAFGRGVEWITLQPIPPGDISGYIRRSVSKGKAREELVRT